MKNKINLSFGKKFILLAKLLHISYTFEISACNI